MLVNGTIVGGDNGRGGGFYTALREEAQTKGAVIVVMVSQDDYEELCWPGKQVVMFDARDLPLPPQFLK